MVRCSTVSLTVSIELARCDMMAWLDSRSSPMREEAMQWRLPITRSADTDEKIFIGKGEQPAWLTLALANRHGLVTGATGTGKTVSLQVMAEGFARAGVPVFAADIKGDLSGISEVGEAKDFILKRAGDMGLTFQPDQFSTVFWDVFGEQGHPVRATVSEMGPLLLSRMMDLNDVQEGVLNVAFRVADEKGLPLIDMKDLRAMLDAIVPDAARKGRMPTTIRWRRSARPRRVRKCHQGRRSGPSSASFWCWKTRAAPNSSASRRWR